MPRHRFHSKKITKDAAGIKHGYRSGLEASIRQQLEEAGIEPNYEGLHLKYTVPETKHIYSPDFPVGKHIIIETKGLFKLEDRKKMLLLKEQYPELDFRFIFTMPISEQIRGIRQLTGTGVRNTDLNGRINKFH